MNPKIIENYSCIGVDVGKIVRRIISNLPIGPIAGLREIHLLDSHDSAFATYSRKQKKINIYVSELLGDFPPLFLKLFYPFTYMVIGMAVGHELDHHVTRDRHDLDREKSAEKNSMKYVYPSLGLFKPVYLCFKFIYIPIHKLLLHRGNKSNIG